MKVPGGSYYVNTTWCSIHQETQHVWVFSCIDQAQFVIAQEIASREVLVKVIIDGVTLQVLATWEDV